MSWFSLRRLRALLSKEIIQMRRDRVTFAMMLGVPLMQLLLFGYAINNYPKHLPAALVAPTQDRFTRAMVSALELTGYYDFTHTTASAAEADSLIARGEVAFVVTIPSDFGQRVERGDNPQILIEADATDPSVASGAISTLGKVAEGALSREIGRDAIPAPVNIVVHRRYNPEGITQYNIIPGLMGVILQMILVMMTSMALTRESERGTMENLLAMPATPLEIMLGKIIPYMCVGAVQVAVVLLVARGLFGVPFVGSFGLLAGGIFAFVLSMVILGYLISTMARTQMQAMQLAFFFFLPSLMLSGFMFPFRGMPGWAQMLGECFPLTHFLRLIRGVMLKGANHADVAQPIAALAVFVLIFGALALSRFRQTLD
ncbi:ABC transporter permease [Paracoccus lutimaris]|uniref:ABC-2 type transport system permease protein n=1 Tax=Paracoccus lutimaris TaxID=1490030 RepID=A0A368YJJ1_9RHOB|nr:ABC transporter permease [Paracoccus lutimaris]RCW79638.1 ABC-2 type transport system permease protein [Paracoccus lutimaris]